MASFTVERLQHYPIEDKDRRLVGTLVLLNWLQIVLIMPSLYFFQDYYEPSEMHFVAGFVCIGMYGFIVVAGSVTAILYARRRTWESLTTSCFFFLMAPFWIWVLTQAPALVLLYCAVPVATIIVIVRIFRESLK